MSEKETIRLLSVDDHELLRHGIRSSLRPFDDIDLVGGAQNGEEALELCDKTNPDVILMDMVLPGDMDGVATTEAVRKQFPHIQVVALSTFYDSTLVKSVMQAGAIGYLVKGVSGEGLAQAIRSAYAGRPAMGKEAVDVLLQPAKITEPTPEFNLTTREQDVLALLVDGLANAEIAAQLHISVSAIKYHVGNIFSKLAVNNRTEAAAKARQYNLF